MCLLEKSNFRKTKTFYRVEQNLKKGDNQNIGEPFLKRRLGTLCLQRSFFSTPETTNFTISESGDTNQILC